MLLSPLPLKFYRRHPIVVAQDLLGKILNRKIGGQILSGIIIEVEAYLGAHDPAAHGYRGKTPSNAILFGEAGRCYVHTIHRYNCLDIVTQDQHQPTSVLIRAIQPVEGIQMMQKLRHKKSIQNLVDGPGKICQALQITRQQNGLSVTDRNSPIIITDGERRREKTIHISTRIGLSRGKNLLLRYQLQTTPS